jgi:hypothetical protein
MVRVPEISTYVDFAGFVIVIDVKNEDTTERKKPRSRSISIMIYSLGTDAPGD